MAPRVHCSTAMLAKLRKEWREFKALPVGKRFQSVHEQQSDAPPWVKVAVLAGAVVSLGIGVLLTFIPGPAIVFFALAGALVAMESASVARALDRGEVAGRNFIARFRRRRGQSVKRSY